MKIYYFRFQVTFFNIIYIQHLLIYMFSWFMVFLKHILTLFPSIALPVSDGQMLYIQFYFYQFWGNI